MKVLIATGHGPESRYFARTLAGRLGNIAGIISERKKSRAPEHGAGARPGLAGRVLGRLRDRESGNLLDMVYEHLFMRGEDEHIRQVKEGFFRAGRYSGFPAGVPLCEVESINAEAAAGFARERGADVLAVQGTGIIKEPLLSMFPRGILNIHGGLPRYRGCWPMFWALYNEDFDYLTASLHFIDPGIDTGDLVMEKKLELEPGDDHHTLRAKYLVEGTGLMAEALEMMARGEELPRLPQDGMEKGRCYFAREATRRKRIELHRKLRRGLVRRYLQSKDR